jgi:hypothetical protein
MQMAGANGFAITLIGHDDEASTACRIEEIRPKSWLDR